MQPAGWWPARRTPTVRDTPTRRRSRAVARRRRRRHCRPPAVLHRKWWRWSTCRKPCRRQATTPHADDRVNAATCTNAPSSTATAAAPDRTSRPPARRSRPARPDQRGDPSSATNVPGSRRAEPAVSAGIPPNARKLAAPVRRLGPTAPWSLRCCADVGTDRSWFSRHVPCAVADRRSRLGLEVVGAARHGVRQFSRWSRMSVGDELVAQG